MDDIQVYDLQTTQPLISELAQNLPRFCQMFGTRPERHDTSNCRIEDVAIFDYNSWPREFMHTEWRDRAIRTVGLLSNLPPIQRSRLHTKGTAGLHACLYENRLDPKLKYIIVSMMGDYCDVHYMIVPKKDIFKLRRNYMRLNKKCSEITHPPVLAEGLLDELVKNTVGFLTMGNEIEKYGVTIKRGIILDGSPGNGKTMACKYIQKLCSQKGIKWGIVDSADIDDAYEHKEMASLFSRYTVTFLDDIDVAYLDRSKGAGKMACTLLTAMDGMVESGHVVRIFTTNEAVEDLDPAFLRPGRIDHCITFVKPTEDLRKRLVDTIWPEEIRKSIDVEHLVNKTEGYSFAEVEAIRTILVTEKLLGSGNWDLDKAFKEFERHRADKKGRKKKGVGFGS